MIRGRLTLPQWTAHPGFGVAVLVAVAVTLVLHGEPQPSSRPSGKSVVVSGTVTARATLPDLLFISDGKAEARASSGIRRVALPVGASPRQVLTSRGLGVVLAVLHGRQHAYAVHRKSWAVRDLGLADAVVPAVTGQAVIIVETAVIGPGMVTEPAAPITGSPTTSASDSSASGSTQSQPPLRDFTVRRFDATGRVLGKASALPPGMRVATDSTAGLVVWQPANRVYDSGFPIEALSADAMLIRPDHSLRSIGAYHPLSATGTSLLIWDVKSRRFGLMPLLNITEVRQTTTSSPAGTSGSKSPEPTKSPPPVEGVKWFAPTRGFLVTGPASFSPDSASFAVYAQVGGRRRLIVAQLRYLGTDQVDVLALAQTEPSPTALATDSSAASSSAQGTDTDATPYSSGTSAPAFDREAFPIAAPLAPSWWKDTLLAVAADGNLIGYRPGNKQASLLDLGLGDLESLAVAP